ncbi:Serine/threonine-protein kinase PknB [Planctomycetes bacterium CA13]|uniref:Serine/threonine-protein kinase PknB n=1 Tax=Novipirellula herctigrandis TaxID=2527986 RepID=A0A5C5Z523_9BACT|nr:Serine/threonine-protein kinase PknB [Planctomycetes bacterium CA13]
MNPLNLFRRSRRKTDHPNAHMTWASRSVAKTVARTGLFLKKQLWVWPIVAVIMLSTIGYFVQNAIEATIKGNVHAGLLSFVNIETEMLEKWFMVQESTAESLANDATVRNTVYALLEKDETSELGTKVQKLEAQRKLADELAPALSAHDFAGFLLVDKANRVVASSHAAIVGEQDVPEYESFTERALNGESFVSPPFSSVVMMKDADGRSRMGVPTMYACSPVRDQSFQVIAVLALQVRPEREFTQILQLGQVGDSGETYAFNSEGVMVSNSRFDESLILLGLLPDQPSSRSMLQLMIRDPGDDMTKGFRPNVRRSQLPLTVMASDAIAGNENVNVEGYRDYRGVPVIGAWRWLPKYKIGVAIEVDTAQSFRPLVILQRTFLFIYSLLILSAIAIFVFTLIVARLQRLSREAVIEAQQLGQYTLEEKLGEGGMGVVYKGHHSMLRRPTAIKLLHAEKVNETSIARFEREVQITCQLNHANTIAIYDYGRTPEGVFYYAMEYLDGIDLQDLVNTYGPQSEARVIHVLLQMCGSLYEAHSQGLVHRDIKPANVMLNRRGCEPDVVKVLDFGLVKAIEQSEDARHIAEGSLTGTPLYMSPESIQAPLSVDARSDIYAVGAVGYFLLTGHPVFEASNLVDLCQKHIDESPVPASKRGNIKVSNQLEDALMSCLEKSRAKRPQTARDLSLLLSACTAAGQWSIADGDRWWGRHERGSQADANNTLTQKSSVVVEATLDQTTDITAQDDQ